jgi:hypothetical protein
LTPANLETSGELNAATAVRSIAPASQSLVRALWLLGAGRRIDSRLDRRTLWAIAWVDRPRAALVSGSNSVRGMDVPNALVTVDYHSGHVGAKVLESRNSLPFGRLFDLQACRDVMLFLVPIRTAGRRPRARFQFRVAV